MAQKTYIVEGRQFRTENDYKLACKDQELLDRLRTRIKGGDYSELLQIRQELKEKKYKFYTLLGQDFTDEVDEMIEKAKKNGTDTGKKKKAATIAKKKSVPDKKQTGDTGKAADIEPIVKEELKKRERNRKILMVVCSLFAVVSLGYFAVYSYQNERTSNTYEELSALKEKEVGNNTPVTANPKPQINYDKEQEVPDVLEEYKILLNKNKKLIGWLKIDDTNINYPVMQTSDNEYYQDHNMNQEYDKNGSIFMDKDCDVLKPSTNFILYGHHMKSGQMFGDLDKYESEAYGKEHPYIEFDTIYEHGIYQVMYVFRSRVYNEDEITFKYYQFIDALSETEFNSNMQEMAAMSLYDTGVTAEFGDQLLTLSTCDYQEKNGRFVVVAKKVAAKEY